MLHYNDVDAAEQQNNDYCALQNCS